MANTSALGMKYDISDEYVNKMWGLNEKHIVFICDDSGSMNTIENGVSRWDELKKTVNMVCDIASAFDPVGMDVHFLNRPTYFGIKDNSILSKCFMQHPSGCTPLITKLREVKDNYMNTNRDILLVIATDGCPSDGSNEQLISVLDQMVKMRFNITFLACTNDNYAIKYLQEIDAKYDKIDVVDDYTSEYNEVIKHKKQFTYGDYIVKMLTGSLNVEDDRVDE